MMRGSRDRHRRAGRTASMGRSRPAFSLVEVMTVVIIIGILAAMVVPQFAGATQDARSTTTASILAGTRASISAFRMRAVLEGDPPFPSLEDLRTPGVVLQQPLPANPITGISGVQAVSRAMAEARGTTAEQTFGWNYFVDNNSSPPVAILYANTTAPTTVGDGSGGVLGASEL